MGPAPVSSSAYPSELGDLEQLEPLDRAILYLGDVEGIPQAHVADQLGLTHQAVRTRASRARRQLRRVIEEEES